MKLRIELWIEPIRNLFELNTVVCFLAGIETFFPIHSIDRIERHKEKRTVRLINMICLPHYCFVLCTPYLGQCKFELEYYYNILISNSIRFQAAQIVCTIHVYLSCMCIFLRFFFRISSFIFNSSQGQ